MTHCILTEPSLKAHARKGREGKGIGSGIQNPKSNPCATHQSALRSAIGLGS